MDSITILLIVATFIFWGVGTFLTKLATNKIGALGLPWNILGYLPIIIYSLLIFKLKPLIQAERSGIGLAFFSGVIGSLGLISFYSLLTKAEATTIVPLTALYPILTIALAFLFLHETVTASKTIGIVLSLIAIYFLSK